MASDPASASPPATTGGPRRPIVGQALRKNAPRALRRDLYSHFMLGTWTIFLSALVTLYLLINLVFAVLYRLAPGSIANAQPDSLLDAFFFSVQTMSTIGYGTLSPATTYGNVVVTLEAAAGMLFVALAAGLVFAKASRPRAATLFSRPMVVHRRNGIPTLSFRVGNARGNEIVDASISATILRDEVTPEGDRMRRLTDLPLVRNRSPLFTLSWTVMHEIDENSPLHGCDWIASSDFVAVIITMTGHDGTYGQTVYSRHVYYPDDVRVNEGFADVISQLDSGRMMIDYSKFHDTEPVSADARVG